MKKIPVLLVEDHAIVRQGLRMLVETEGDIEIIAEAKTGREAVQMTHTLRPEIIVMDIAMPMLNGLEATRQILKAFPATKVLILSAHSDAEYVEQVVKAGARGYLLKQNSGEVLAKAIRELYRGKTYFTPAIARKLQDGFQKSTDGVGLRKKTDHQLTSRETELLQLIAEGQAIVPVNGQGTNASASSPPSLPAAASTDPSDPFAPTMQSFSNYQCPEWFRDAKFGIWSHWGPDSIPGIGNGYAHDMWSQGNAAYNWHLAHYGHPSQKGYKDVIESWTAEKWEPDALVAKYKAAGAKYIVALATHHDNFDCWDSTYHEWNSVKHGPHKDIVGMWRDAALKAGLRFGVSSHADERGWNYMYGARLSDKTGPLTGVPYEGANPALESLYNSPTSDKDKPPEEWKQLWLKRHLDLVDKYHPDLLYFDGGIPHGQYGMQLIAHYLDENAKDHNGQEEGVVNVKAGSFVRDYERGISATLQDKPWQDDTSLAGWFYINHNPHSDVHSLPKSATTIIHTLIDVVSKNGNLLMNFPQRGDGSLYPECEDVLAELAKWMPVNGEGIFNTRPWTTFGEGPNLIAAGYMNEPMQPLTWKDIRYTTKGKVLYAFCLGIPQGEIKMTALASIADKIANIELLGASEKISWKAAPDALVIEPSSKWPCDHAVCYRITLN